MKFPSCTQLSSVTLIVLMFGYSIQMFADFAGYSFVAMGIGELFGYSLMLNFNLPYISGSFSEFWRRWHISLSNWLRDYLYISLGGNRKGNMRTYLNLVLVMFLGGLWHGAGWNYATWGLMHGVFLAAERPFLRRKINNDKAGINPFRIIIVFTLVSFLWLFFKFTDINQVFQYAALITRNWSMLGMSNAISSILVLSSPVVLYHLFYLFRERKPIIWLQNFDYIAYGGMMFLILINKGGQSAFIYFQF